MLLKNSIKYKKAKDIITQDAPWVGFLSIGFVLETTVVLAVTVVLTVVLTVSVVLTVVLTVK